ncbi:F-box protein CPR1 [Citrus sinensis]|nr:F-box protein CPR1 [Citrus sinensis]
MASLPEDVLIEILSRLPVKSSIRFRRHVKNYNVNHSHLVVKRNDDQTWYMFLDEMLENNLSYENLNDAVPMDHLKIEGYGVGLFCLSRRTARFFLWNPATKEIKTLPRCRPRDISFPEVGFGFNHIKNDFELVLIAQFEEKGLNEDDDYSVKSLYEFVGVYALSTNRWRTHSLCRIM